MKVTLAVVGLYLVAAQAFAGEASTAWSGHKPAKTRLIVESKQFVGAGTIRAGVHVRLSDGWWTYWRAPGASGMPPMFDWSKSENLADEPNLIWPVPLRAVEYGESLNTYRGEVVFPIEFRAKNPAKPIKLHLRINYGVCRDICVPSDAEHEIVLRPAKGRIDVDQGNAALIAAFTGKRPSADPFAAGMEIREVRTTVDDGKVTVWIRVAGLEEGASSLVLIEGPGFLRVGEVKPRGTDDSGAKLLALKVGAVSKFRTLKGKRVRITIIDGPRALEQVWVVGASGSSLVGLGLTPLRRPTEKPEPYAQALAAFE